MLAKEYWREGYALECLRGVTNRVFETTDVDEQLAGFVHPANVPPG